MSEKKIVPLSEKRFSDVVGRIFQYNGYVCLSQEVMGMSQKRQKVGEPDWVFEKNNQRYIAEIVLSRNSVFPDGVLLYIAEQVKRYMVSSIDRPMLIVGGVLKPSTHEELSKHGIVIIDILNLLYMVRNNQELRDDLVSTVPFSVDTLKPKEKNIYTESNEIRSKGGWSTSSRDFSRYGTGSLQHGSSESIGPSIEDHYDDLQQKKEYEELRKELEKWKGGRGNSSSEYEKFCTRVLKRLFADDLMLWREQAKSDAGLFRFDLICKIKRDTRKEFWEMAERYYNSKYIIFEFKNYSDEVTQKEIFTTVRYLYATALRCIAIIISPNGIDKHADTAIRGILRDEGKLILTLTNEELSYMLQMKESKRDPADYLSDKLDELLIDLEK